MSRRPVDALAVSVMVLLCMSWGFQQVTIKWGMEGVSPILQAGIRSAVAMLLLVAWARIRGLALFGRDGTLAAGLACGVLFAGEFLFIYAGLAHTSASRMIVFVYLAPCLTALGLQCFVPGEQLGLRQWTGIFVAFGGIALAFVEGFSSARGATAVGDACGVIAAVLWAATTVTLRATRLSGASATKTLFYQLAVSAIALLPASPLLGERGVVALTPQVILCLAYQGAVVAFASYLAWFWLLTRYLAGRLAVFSFLTPLFGVLAGAMFLSEPLTAAFVGAALLVGAGIVLVNWPGREPAAA